MTSGKDKPKPVYRTPVLVQLGDLVKSVGAACSAGQGVTGGGIGQCTSGGGARGQCNMGNGIKGALFAPYRTPAQQRRK